MSSKKEKWINDRIKELRENGEYYFERGTNHITWGYWKAVRGSNSRYWQTY